MNFYYSQDFLDIVAMVFLISTHLLIFATTTTVFSKEIHSRLFESSYVLILLAGLRMMHVPYTGVISAQTLRMLVVLTLVLSTVLGVHFIRRNRSSATTQ
ncbi:MAG: hypothetical protein V4576_01835 [Patescibacteria group bacterium]